MEMVNLDNLSDDAKVMLGSHFGLFGNKFTLTFQMRQSRPSDRTKAALDELVEKGVLEFSWFNDFGGYVYKALMDCSPSAKWYKRVPKKDARYNWQIAENMTEEESVQYMRPFGQGVYIKEKTTLTISASPYEADTEEHKQWMRGYRAGSRVRKLT